MLAVGFLLFGAAAGVLYYALRPATLRIAVGPPGSDDQKLIQAMAKTFVSEGRAVRLSPITTDGAVEALALLHNDRLANTGIAFFKPPIKTPLK